MNLNTVVFMNLTGKELLLTGAAVFVVSIVIPTILRLLGPSNKSPDIRLLRCPCGWAGMVSRESARCPKCNAPLKG